MAPQPAQTMTPAQQNQLARDLIARTAIPMTQQIMGQNLSGTIPGQIINIPIRPVGLITGLVFEIEFDLVQTAAETLNRTAHGAANIISNFTLTDFSNQQRINTSGWHINMLGTARRMSAFGAAFTNDSTSGVGSNMPVMLAPAAVTTVQKIRMFYELPISYSDFDLRGAIWGNVSMATANLQVTINPNLVIASTGSGTLAAYKSTTAAVGTISNAKFKVYQKYLDQIQYDQRGQPILPAMDLSIAYELKNTVFTGFAVGQDNPIPYSNFRQFMSTCAIVDQAGTLNNGSDVNYWSLVTSNFTNIFNVDPYMQLLGTRNEIGDDFPLGTYYFNHRRKPIDTQTYGNMQLNLNPSTFAAQAQVLVGFEALSFQNIVTQASSLPAN